MAEPAEPAPQESRSDRVALLALLGALVVALPLIVVHLGRKSWFYQDEWDFLVTREAGSLHDLLRPHNEHWSTLPVLVYRGLFSVFGLRTYLPYQAVVVVLHLTVVLLLWLVLRRCGVRAWVATFIVAPLILFGAGRADIVRAFNMTFVGSLAFGLAQLLLVDHDGRWNRRDWLGLAAGAAALLCSGIGVTMVIVVGIAALLGRGWRVAAAQTVPLGVLYLVWFLAQSPPTGSNPVVAASVTSPSRSPASSQTVAAPPSGGWVTTSPSGSSSPPSSWRVSGWRGGARGFDLLFDGRHPLALLAGTGVLFTISGWGRWSFGPAYAAQSRYLYLGAALVLPALGVAIEALGSRWSPAVPVALLVLFVGVPGNIALFGTGSDGAQQVAQRQLILSLPHSPLAEQVPPEVRPDPTNSSLLSIGWLLQQEEDGQLPDPGPVPSSISSQVPLRLGLQQSLLPVRLEGCAPTESEIIRSPAVGDRIVLAGDEAAISVRDGTGWTPPVLYDVATSHLFVVQLPDLTLRVEPGAPDQELAICH